MGRHLIVPLITFRNAGTHHYAVGYSSVRKGEPSWSEGDYPNYRVRVVEDFEVVAGKDIDNGFQGLGLSDTRLRQEGWCMVLSLVV